MSSFTSGFQSRPKRFLKYFEEASGPVLALTIYYDRYVEMFGIFLWRCTRLAADVHFWLTMLAVVTGVLSDPISACLLAVVGVLWWALVLISREKAREAESPNGGAPLAARADKKVVDLLEYRNRLRRRDDRGGRGRWAA